MIKRILVPTDGSQVSQKAAKYAVNLAKQTGATLIFLHVLDDRFLISQSVPASSSPVHVKESVKDYLDQAMQSYIKESAALCKRNDLSCQVLTMRGHPVSSIIKKAAAIKADLIVMGSHGRSGLQAVMLGSVTHGVLNSGTKIPVLVIKK
ncbi:MAG: universal stress protein [Nitrospirota bacterium]